eukprot:scaffold743_cov267-Pinguiococcus_pyrenoidosus.AAC.13
MTPTNSLPSKSFFTWRPRSAAALSCGSQRVSAWGDALVRVCYTRCSAGVSALADFFLRPPRAALTFPAFLVLLTYTGLSRCLTRSERRFSTCLVFTMARTGQRSGDPSAADGQRKRVLRTCLHYFRTRAPTIDNGRRGSF